MANGEKPFGDLNFDAVSKFLERMAKITGMAYRRVQGADGSEHIQFSVPVSPVTLPAIMAAIPAALAEEAIDNALGKGKQPPPSNTHFDGKRRF